MFGAPNDQYHWNGKQPVSASPGPPPTSTPPSAQHPNDYQGGALSYNKKMQGGLFNDYYGSNNAKPPSPSHDLPYPPNNPGPPPRSSYQQNLSSTSSGIHQAPYVDFYGSKGKPPSPLPDPGYSMNNPGPPLHQNPYQSNNSNLPPRGNVAQFQQDNFQGWNENWDDWNNEPFVPVDQPPPAFSTPPVAQVTSSDQFSNIPLHSETSMPSRGAAPELGYRRFSNQSGGLHSFNNNINQDWKWQSPHNSSSPANHSQINNNQAPPFKSQLQQQQHTLQNQQQNQQQPLQQQQQSIPQQPQTLLHQQPIQPPHQPDYQQEATAVENINNILTDLSLNAEPTVDAYWSDVDHNLLVDTGESSNDCWQSKEPAPSSLERHVTGQTMASEADNDCSNERGDGAEDEEGPQPNDQRMVPGQLSDEEVPNTNSDERMVTGQTSEFDNRSMYSSNSDLQSNERLRARWNESSISQERLVAGESAVGSDNLVRTQSSSVVTSVNLQSNNSRLIPGQGNSCDTLSNADLDFGSERRMIPGHRDDTDPSTSGPSSVADSRAGSEQRMVPGQVTIDDGDDRLRLQNNLNDNSLSNSNIETPRPALDSESGFERTTPAGRNTGEENSNPLPDFQRMVVGQLHQDDEPLSLSQADNSQADDGANHDSAENNELPPPGLHRMVVGEIRGENTPSSAAKETDKTPDDRNDWDRRRSDREPRNVDDSGSEYRKRDKSDKKWSNEKSRHRRRRETDEYSDYSSPERNYRRSRDDIYRPRRDDRYHKKREERDHKETPYEPSQDESGSDREGDRKYQDGRRRRRHRRPSPEPYYDYYHDDPRHYPGHNRHPRHYDYDYRYYKERSRPSSRTESDYRRMYPMYDARASKSFYGPGFSGTPNIPMDPQYLLRLRETDPQKYAQWYTQYQLYMASQFASGTAEPSHPTDRSSVHSGRSSANNGQLKTSMRALESCTLDDDNISKLDDVASPRNTPAKFSTAHIKGILNNRGNLLVINPSYPLDNHPATIDEYPLQPNLSDDPDLTDFLQCPGPFIVGTTHKNTVLQYLRLHAEKSSSSAESLLYSLIQLVIKLNGVILGTDIAELLVENYQSSVGTTEFDRLDKFRETQETPKLSPAEVTKKFRQLLLQGNKGEALDWAMTNNDWGHALLLASKMDARTYNNVLANFANGLPASDPLQTLYQLMSGREPQAVTCCGDERWGDWRPHLAMILSNPSSRPEIDRKAIITLGDSLSARGRLFAAHFCYLTAQLEFSSYSKPSAKCVLLGSSHTLPFSLFATNSAIMLSLCYEYAKKLHNKNFVIPTLQPYKYLLATRLVDWGRPNIALQYLEAAAIEILRDPNLYGHQFSIHTLELAEKIKYSDISLSLGGDVCDDPDWLVDLRRLVDDAMDGNFRLSDRGSTSNLTISDPHDMETASHSQISSQQQNLPSVASTQEPYYFEGPQQPVKQQDESNPNVWQPPPSQSYYGEANNIGGYEPQTQALPETQDPSQNQWNYSNNLNPGQTDHSQWASNQSNSWGAPTEVENNQQVSNQQADAPWGMQSSGADYKSNAFISSSQPASFDYYPQSKENNQAPNSLPPVPDYGNKNEVPSKTQTSRPETKKSEKNGNLNSSSSGGGWFGGMFGKLLRPKNQMKLPEDTNPQIVWDDQKKRWVNRNSDKEEVEAEFKPPPKAADLSFNPSATSSPSSTTSQDNSLINSQLSNVPPPSGNKYKLQRGRGMRSNYVDIMNPSGGKPVAPQSAQPMFPLPAAQTAPVNNFFIPAPIENSENLPTDFVSPSGYVQPVPSTDQHAELSRCSSASSLSREVSFYMSRPHRH